MWGSIFIGFGFGMLVTIVCFSVNNQDQNIENYYDTISWAKLQRNKDKE